MDTKNFIEMILGKAAEAANQSMYQDIKPNINVKKDNDNARKVLSDKEFIKVCFEKLEAEERNREKEKRREILTKIKNHMRAKLEQRLDRGLCMEFAQLVEILDKFDSKLDKNEEAFIGKLLSRFD